MKVVIIEDEKPAALKLRNALQKIDQGIEVETILFSLQESIDWFSQNSIPDLLFMDIELSDGRSFGLFDHLTINCPVIFTTAYDEYWQEAFEHNSIDYLLKPVKEEKLIAALSKFESLKKYFAQNFKNLQTDMASPPGGPKKRFLVKRGVDYISIKAEEIACFYATHKLVCLMDTRGQKFILDQSLSEIERQVDPGLFYRVNRKYLVSINAITRIKSFPRSKLHLELDPPVEDEILISQENVSAFKNWMDR